jgi:serine phosphatase RsbU (regulator of sigma subunit)
MKLRAKITFVTLSTVVVLFLISMVINTYIFYKEAKEFRNSEIKSSYVFFLEQVNFATNHTTSIGNDLASAGELINRLKSQPKNKLKEHIESYLVDRVSKEPKILGAGIWYEPYVLGEVYYAPYAVWKNNKVEITWEYSNSKYDYHNQPWYRVSIPKTWNLNEKREFENYQVSPYLDKLGDQEILFVTVSSIMYDENNKIIGVSSVDWTFEDLHKLLSQFNITKSSYTTLMHSEGKIVYHPNKEFILKDSTSLSWYNKLNLKNIVKNQIYLIENEKIGNEEFDIYYSITSANYILAAIINKKEAYSIVGGIVLRNIGLSFITILLLSVFIFIVVDLSIKPLGKIIHVLRGIASGKIGLDERIQIKTKDEFSELADTFNNMASTIQTQNNEIKEYSENLEEKVKTRTYELNQSLDEITKLKKQQDGDYFLTSLLLTPLGKINSPNSNVVQVEALIRQKKTFDFKNKSHSIGGDLCVVDKLVLKNKSYTVYLNADAMGKSIQGAGGALILGSVFGAIIERTNSVKNLQDQYPERWIKNTFLELHKTFSTFDGSMLVSVVFGLLDYETGLLYLINAEHPSTILYRDKVASFLESDFMFYKLGLTVEMKKSKLSVRLYQLKTDDVIILGSDGRDDILLSTSDTGDRVINEDHELILKEIETADADLNQLLDVIQKTGELTDDFSILKLTYKGPYYELQSTHPNILIENAIKKSKDLELKKQIPEAYNTLREVLPLDTEFPYLLRELTKLGIQLKHYQTALEYADKYISLRPIDTEIIYAKSYLYMKLLRTSEAIDLGELILLREPSNLKYLAHLSELYLEANPNRARDLVLEGLKLDPIHKKLLSLKQSIDTI